MEQSGYNKKVSEPLSKSKNRAQQIPFDQKSKVGITLYDIDYAMMEYMTDVVIPDVEENGTKVKVPLIYGNPERWKSATKDGFIRDQRGRIQIPLIMYKRNSIARDDSSITILSYGYTYMTIFSFIIVLFHWQTPSLQTLIYLFFGGLFGTLLHLCINHAYKLVDVSVTQPYSFLSLVFASLIGFYVFNETPDVFTWIGASVIFLGVLIISYREMKLEKEIIRKSIDIKN